MPLSKDEIKARKHAPESVDVPDWGGSVLVKKLSGTEREAWERWMSDQRDKEGVDFVKHGRAGLLVLCLVDADGKRLFGDDEIADLSDLDGGGAALDLLWDVACRLNGIGRKAVEDTVKN